MIFHNLEIVLQLRISALCCRKSGRASSRGRGFVNIFWLLNQGQPRKWQELLEYPRWEQLSCSKQAFSRWQIEGEQLYPCWFATCKIWLAILTVGLYMSLLRPLFFQRKIIRHIFLKNYNCLMWAGSCRWSANAASGSGLVERQQAHWSCCQAQRLRCSGTSQWRVYF